MGEKTTVNLIFFPLKLIQYTDTGLIFLLPEMGSSLTGVCSHPSEFFPLLSSAVATGLTGLTVFSPVSLVLCSYSAPE